MAASAKGVQVFRQVLFLAVLVQIKYWTSFLTSTDISLLHGVHEICNFSGQAFTVSWQQRGQITRFVLVQSLVPSNPIHGVRIWYSCERSSSKSQAKREVYCKCQCQGPQSDWHVGYQGKDTLQALLYYLLSQILLLL